VQQSSESVAALAAALAKAQAQLVNPEKSLTATIRPGRQGETERSFRYAPLSSGLEIVRKTLSEHEIAVMQTTAIDLSSRLLNLTTTLAHSSGQWIASQWPVCPLADIVSPHRMGAALTYARRYALFTLVGIAGEDDLDASDLCTPVTAMHPSGPGTDVQGSPKTPGNGKVSGGTAKTTRSPVLPAEQSAMLRDSLVKELASLESPDSAAEWAVVALPRKNTLTAADARLVETAFALKQSGFSLAKGANRSPQDLPNPASASKAPAFVDTPASGDPNPAAECHGKSGNVEEQETGRIDKSALMLSTPRRYRNKDHLRFVMHQPCLLCGRKPSDAHHIRYVQPRALGRKASDEFTVPLCRSHHRALHRAGNEQVWWQHAGIDPLTVARKLWKRSRTIEARIESGPPKTSTITSDGASEAEGRSTGVQA
jgi:hypothetical protein